MTAGDRHSTQMLRDAAVQAQVRDRGYAVLPDVLGPSELTALCDEFFQSIGRTGVIGDTWFTSGMLPDPSERRALFERVGTIVLPSVVGLFSDGAQVLSGHFHVNPPGPSGGLGPHQDVALVDETAAFTLNGWIPLVDARTDNGCLRVVPGSHRFGNRDRSLTVPWAYEGLHDLFWEFAVPVEARAGSMVIFDTALIHGSLPNESDVIRPAVNLLATPPGVPIVHLVADDQTPAGALDVFEVPVTFYLEGDLALRPPAGVGELVSRRAAHRPRATTSHVRQLCTDARSRATEGP